MHGQCLDVGVGGYLLGGGVNIAGSTNRFGTGSEHVEEYTLVTAEGDIIIVNKDNVTKVDPHGHGGYEVHTVLYSAVRQGYAECSEMDANSMLKIY